ncbi:hypothetical protein MMC07_002403 [Pseudocyphellaria aurata]|nr:hypothetical protein [Pseudocyphellaria aurata]
MSSMMLHTRRTRTYSNQSCSEKDLAKSLQRGSVQSINSFSLRRLLGSDPSNHSSSSRYSPETSNSITQTISKDDEDCQPPSAVTNSIEITSEPPLSPEFFPENEHSNTSGDLISNAENGSDVEVSLPAVNKESGSSLEQPPETRPPSSAPMSMFHRSIFAKKPHAKASTILRQNPLKENQIPKSAQETGKFQRRPASSPAPPGPVHLKSLKLVIPDRHSSLSPPHITSAVPSASTITPAMANPHSPTRLSGPTARFNTAVQLLQPSLTDSLSPPPPPLNLCHYSCYQLHRHMCFSPNVHNPVPCMTCGAEIGQTRWKCCWCCLRICDTCMEDLSNIKDRNLTLLMKGFADGKVGLGRVGRPKAIMVKGRRRVDEEKGRDEKEEVGGQSEGKKKDET